jgi:hypothetical protein
LGCLGRGGLGLPIWQFPRKKLFRGIRKRRNSFRRNFVCFAERKTHGIPFRAIPRKIKMVRISVLNHFVEENNTQELRNFVPFRTIPRRIKMLRIPFKTILQKSSRQCRVERLHTRRLVGCRQAGMEAGGWQATFI